ncbi:MAG: hypothetical protein ACXAEU_17140 [Candidatus Hodarchaeales archaeon]|jgi:hypothetical protein
MGKRINVVSKGTLGIIVGVGLGFVTSKATGLPLGATLPIGGVVGGSVAAWSGIETELAKEDTESLKEEMEREQAATKSEHRHLYAELAELRKLLETETVQAESETVIPKNGAPVTVVETAKIESV